MANLTKSFDYATFKSSITRLTNYPAIYPTGGNGTISANDEGVLKEMFAACVSDLVIAGSMYAPNLTKSNDNYTVTFTMPSNWDSNATTSAQFSMEDYVRNELTARWFAYVNREDVEKYQAKANAALLSLRQKLNMKIKPTR